MIARVLCVLALLCGLATAEGRPRVAVIGDAGVAKAVRGAIGKKVELVEVAGDDPRALAAEHLLHAVIVVSIANGRAVAVVHQGEDGAEVGRHQVKAPRKLLARRMGQQLWGKLGKKIVAARAPAPPPPEPVAAPPPAPAATEVAEATTTTTTSTGAGGDVTASTGGPARDVRTLTFAVEERPFWRRLRYADDIADRLRPSDLVANAVGVAASYRPLRRAPGLLVTARGELAVGVNGSRTPDGMAFGTSSSEWSLAAAYDLAIGPARAGIDVAYGEHRFHVADEGMMPELVPDVTYRWARGGLAVDYPLTSRWVLSVAAGWRQLLGTGELGGDAWFPRQTGNGIDGGAGIRLRVTGWLELRARLDVRRYFFAMNPEPGDPWIAGGAVDQYLGAAIGFAISPR